MTIREITRLFGAADCTVRRWIASGQLTPVATGRKPLRFDVLEVAELVADHPRAGRRAA